MFEDPREVYPVPERMEFSAVLHELFDALGCDGYALKFDNDVFYLRAYCWCDRKTCPQCGDSPSEYNFFYKPEGLGLTWYKYAIRAGYFNRATTLEDFRRIITLCIESVRPDDSSKSSSCSNSENNDLAP